MARMSSRDDIANAIGCFACLKTPRQAEIVGFGACDGACSSRPWPKASRYRMLRKRWSGRQDGNRTNYFTRKVRESLFSAGYRLHLLQQTCYELLQHSHGEPV